MAVAFSLRLDWAEVLLAVVWPRLSNPHAALLTVVAVFGTTISPYLFFWQAAQEVEEADSLSETPRSAEEVRRHLGRIRLDTVFGWQSPT